MNEVCIIVGMIVAFGLLGVLGLVLGLKLSAAQTKLDSLMAELDRCKRSRPGAKPL